MSVHWSSEVMKWEYREMQATAMSVDFSGNNVLLAGRRWLAIKQLNLEEEAEIIKKYPRQSKYDAAGAEWCQTYHGQKLCAIASNQRVDVYEWRNGNDLACICSLRGHTRVVSDTHFHRQDHNLIATCSIDTFTHMWDLRDARKPVISLCAVAGASQVQWNKVASHIVATAHDGDIKIWDYRKHSAPFQYISAHLCKIHGVDWSPHHEYQLVTSSHDGSIKFFDINNARRPENVIMTNFPVWRAIYTPFGSGLLTIGVGWGGLPRVEQAGVIGIWVAGALTHRLVGHTDTVQTMVWRPNTSPSNFQLVTWGRDQSLRVWAMQPSLLKMCHHYLPNDSDNDEDNNSDTISYASTVESMNDATDSKGQDIQMTKMTSSTLTSIDEEFESIREMANMEVTDMNIETRICQIHSERNGYTANLQVAFPRNVSEQTIPKFSWLSGTNVDSSTTIKILQALNKMAYRKKKEGQRCLLHCLKTLATSIDEIPVKTSDDSDSMKSSQRSQSESENAGDSCIPFPRTSGAKWCGVSTLVVFNRPSNTRRLSLKPEAGTPRSMSSLSTLPGLFSSGYSSVSPHATTTPSPTNAPGFPQLLHRHPSNSITTFYFQDRWKAQGRRAGSMRSRGSISGCSPRVLLYAAGDLFPLNRTLAEKYVINPDDSVEMCSENARIACAEGESELGHAWRLAALTARAQRARLRDHAASSEESLVWAAHPLCCNLLHSLYVTSNLTQCADGESELGHAWRLAALTARAQRARLRDHAASSEESLVWAAHPLCCNLLHSLYVTSNLTQCADGESELGHAWRLAALTARAQRARLRDHAASSEESLVWAAHPLCCNLLHSLYVTSNLTQCADGESELGHAWRLAALTARAQRARLRDHAASSEESLVWAAHPLCCNLLHSLISHYAKASDVQMAAMLACAFSIFNDTNKWSSQSTISYSSNGNGTSPYSTVNQYSEIADGWTTVRSDSCSEADNLQSDTTRSELSGVLDDNTVHQYHCFKRVYADILHRWQLLYKRTEVMKLVSGPGAGAPGAAGPALCAACAACGRAARGAACAHCRRLALRCAVCALGVRGLAAACAFCGHAGHARHMLLWFESHDTCPTGCGCKCLVDSSAFWKGIKYA